MTLYLEKHVRPMCVVQLFNLRAFLIIKANEMQYFSNLFDKVLYMFRTGPLSIIRRISTLYTHNRDLFCWLPASRQPTEQIPIACIQC